MHNLVFDGCHVCLQIIFQSHSSSIDSTLFFHSTRNWFHWFSLIFIWIHWWKINHFQWKSVKTDTRWKSYSVLQHFGDHLHRFQYPTCPIPCPKCHLEPDPHSSATFIELSCGKFQSFFHSDTLASHCSSQGKRDGPKMKRFLSKSGDRSLLFVRAESN